MPHYRAELNIYGIMNTITRLKNENFPKMWTKRNQNKKPTDVDIKKLLTRKKTKNKRINRKCQDLSKTYLNSS